MATKKLINFAWKATVFVLACVAITAYILLICKPI